MSKTVLATVNGFTPLIDSVVKAHGLVSAAVFGRIWRYCQGERGVCQATLDRIGDDLALDKATVQRHAVRLCEAGYLEDTTPNLRNKPHTYRDTGKAGISVGLVATDGGHVAQSNVTLQPATSDSTKQRDVAQSQLKKEVKRQPNIDKERDGAPGAPPSENASGKGKRERKAPDPRSASAEVKAYREVTGRYPHMSLYDLVIAAASGKSVDYLKPFYTAWVARGHNPNAATWLLEWAVAGAVPANGGNKHGSTKQANRGDASGNQASAGGEHREVKSPARIIAERLERGESVG